MNEVLSPVLIVGLGGSGGMTARFLHREVRRRLHDCGWDGPMPACWQFLQIDAPAVADGHEASVPEQLLAVGGHYAGLYQPGHDYRRVDSSAVPEGADRDLLGFFIGWRPDPSRVMPPIPTSPPLNRAVGRMVAARQFGHIQRALASAIAEMTSAAAGDQLAEVSRLLGAWPGASPNPLVILVSSIGGRSGSGMVQDVADILRASGPAWASDSLGVLYTDDVFSNLPGRDRANAANSLAALSELMAAYWNDQDASRSEFAGLARHGIEVGLVHRRGVRFPFLVGRGNSTYAFADQFDVFSAVGRMLAITMTTPSVQDRMVAFLLASWRATASTVSDHSGIRPPMFGEAPFNSFGSASVSLGRDRLARYAAERLARSAVDRLLRGHLEGWPGDAEGALREGVNATWSWFVQACGLEWEHAPELRVPDELRLDAGADDDQALRHAAAGWADQVAGRIERATTEALGRPRVGIGVVVGLLGRLQRHLNEMADELHSDWPDTERNLRDLMATLLGDLAENLVGTLASAMDEAGRRLAVQERPISGPSTVEDWPPGETVPRKYGPAVNELLLEEVSSYPSRFSELIQATTGVQRASDGERAAVREVVMGEGSGVEPGSGPVVSASATWWPTSLADDRPAAPAAPAAPARYTVRLEPDDVLERAARWVRRPNTPMGDHLGVTLREYLTEGNDGRTTAARQATFLECLGTAIAQAEPLVQVSNGLLTMVHDMARPRLAYAISEIPLDQTSLLSRVIDVLRTARTIQDRSTEDGFVASNCGTGGQRSVEIVTWFETPVEPIVLDSVMRPLAAEWAVALGNADRRERFWRWRRTRPLTEFVPLGATTRRAVVAGWFLARLLGELTWSETNDGVGPDGMIIPSRGIEGRFPAPLLGSPVTDEKDLLAAVLESLPLALVACNTTGSLHPLLPYQRLIEVGGEEAAATALRIWIADGATPAGTEPLRRAWSPRGEDIARSDSSPVERKQAVLDYLEGRYASYVTSQQEIAVTRDRLGGLPRWFELRDDYVHALGMLRRVAAAVPTTETAHEGD